VTVDNTLSDTHTVIEVKAPDRVGLLHLVTRTLAAEGLDIATAKIATDMDHALDVFYVTDQMGRRIEAPAALGRLRAALEQALAEECPAGAGSV
jgi:[protein-PII] uridylyltransferase